MGGLEEGRNTVQWLSVPRCSYDILDCPETKNLGFTSDSNGAPQPVPDVSVPSVIGGGPRRVSIFLRSAGVLSGRTGKGSDPELFQPPFGTCQSLMKGQNPLAMDERTCWSTERASTSFPWTPKLGFNLYTLIDIVWG
ncbi:Rieske domain-containing protein isoform X3 [Trachemys scripta elegans]|uniref:Rieske domain-containing protein isoform X3 n=1 Tax=Trachemys scripta elegans TaxID=31138 RepID=UPI0015519E0D|nr:Rieske domain-containing protein isoform X3 [Trachemys scripta elegans]